jgi:hypothetical protein
MITVKTPRQTHNIIKVRLSLIITGSLSCALLNLCHYYAAVAAGAAYMIKSSRIRLVESINPVVLEVSLSQRAPGSVLH